MTIHRIELTLEDIQETIKLEGGPAKVACKIGAHLSTVYKWTTGERRPKGLYLKEFLKLVGKHFEVEETPQMGGNVFGATSD